MAAIQNTHPDAQEIAEHFCRWRRAVMEDSGKQYASVWRERAERELLRHGIVVRFKPSVAEHHAVVSSEGAR